MNAGWSEIKGALTEFAKNYFPRDMYEVFKENGMFATEGKNCLFFIFV